MELPLINFFTADMVGVFFQNVYAIMYVIMPLLIISVATALAGYLVSIIVNIFSYRGDQEDNYDREINKIKN